MAKAKKCGEWKLEHRRSGAAVHVRRCGAFRAEIGLGTTTYNIYRNNKWVTRGSAANFIATRAAATRKMVS